MSMRITNDFITLNDNNFFERPSIIASSINEVNEVSPGYLLNHLNVDYN